MGGRALGLVLVCLPLSASATTYSVTKTTDDSAACTINDCSLRAALAKAVGGDTISLDASPAPATYTLSTSVANIGTGSTNSGQTITVVGQGIAATKIQQNALGTLGDNTTSFPITVTNLTISGGTYGYFAQNASNTLVRTFTNVKIENATGNGIYVVSGLITATNLTVTNSNGGVYNMGAYTVSLTNSTLTGNTSYGVSSNGTINITGSTLTTNGGAAGPNFPQVYNNGGVYTTTIDNTTITGGPGLGINLAGHLTVTNSKITNNALGGIQTSSGGYTFILTNSTVSGNGGFGVSTPASLSWQGSTISGNNGGGLLYNSSTGNITNCTFSGNHNNGDGGGIAITSGQLNLDNCTITGNVADANNDGTGDGGGIAVAGGVMQIANSIVAANTDGSPATQQPDCHGTLTNGAANLIKDLTGCTLSSATQPTISGMDAKLGVLADNGGPTFTHALLKGSPALNAGTPFVGGMGTVCATLDQRGGRNRNAGPRCDLGAFEQEKVDLALAASPAPMGVPGGSSVTFHLTVSNIGPNPANNLVLSDTLPSGASLTMSTPVTGSWVCSGTAPVSCTLANLPISSSASVDLVMTAPNTTGTATNMASVTSTEADLDSADNSSSSSVLINPADLTMSVSVPGAVPVGSDVTYMLTIHNAGPATASGVSVTDNLAPGLTFMSATPSQGIACSGTTTITCGLGTLAKDADATVVIVGRAPADALLVNMASVSATEPDPSPANNAVTSSTVAGTPDLAGTMTNDDGGSSEPDLAVETMMKKSGGSCDCDVGGTSPSLPLLMLLPWLILLRRRFGRC